MIFSGNDGSLGFRYASPVFYQGKAMISNVGMLPEWSRQEAVMLAWPHADTDWQPWLPAIQQDYVELTAAISIEARPLVLCRDDQHRKLVAQLLAGHCLNSPILEVVPYNDTWCRDYGPVTVVRNGNLELMDFRFGGWGDKYAASLDNAVNRALRHLWRVRLRSIEYELEGGSIETDGNGTLLTTVQCLQESKRNPGFDREEKERQVLQMLDLERALWISEGALAGDDTDSHIDNLVRFCGPETIAYLSCSDREDEHFDSLRRMEQQVLRLRQSNGEPYKCHAIELPQAQHDEYGNRLPASYVNFLILNGSVLVPVFACPQDQSALQKLGKCFPGKKLVPVPGSNLVRQFGGPHCATMQLPSGTLNSSL